MGADMGHCGGVGRNRRQRWGDPIPHGVLLGSVPALCQLPEFARGKCVSVTLGSGSSGAGQSCTWLSHAGSNPEVFLGHPAQLCLLE